MKATTTEVASSHVPMLSKPDVVLDVARPLVRCQCPDANRSSILSEVDDTSILRTGLSTCYRYPLHWRPASRLLPPRSGLERSDFVPWPIATLPQEFMSPMPPKADIAAPTRVTLKRPWTWSLEPRPLFRRCLAVFLYQGLIKR
jgi:hypothetical protein